MAPARALILALSIALLPATSRAVTPAALADRDLDRALEALVAMDGGPPGAIAIVHRGGQAAVHRAGTGNLETGARIEPGDHMRLASVSKAYSGAVALALVDRGLLSLEDTVRSRLPDLPAAWGAVTLRQMLNHTSGLPDYISTQRFQEALAADPTAEVPSSTLLGYAADLPLNFPPGTRYQYSNSDNVAVGYMVEAATDRSYEEELARLVLTPLRLAETSLPVAAAMPRPFVHGYLFEAGAVEDVSEALSPSGVWASGGVVSTPLEVGAFFRGNLGGRLFGRDQQRAQLQVVRSASSDPPGPGRNAAGLGIFRYETRCGTVYGHTGNFPGYTQFVAASRDGARSASVSIDLQLRPDIDERLYAQMRRAEELAVCAALAPGRAARLPLRRNAGGG